MRLGFRLPRAACWPYLLPSIAIHVFYNLLLMRCYRLGEFGQVYPLARGTSPLVVTILAAIFVHEHLALPQVAGVLVVSAGLAVLVVGGRRPRLAGEAGGRPPRTSTARPSWPPSAPASRSRRTPRWTAWACGCRIARSATSAG